jgi:putative FmdB family regulatory protein
MPLYFYKCPKCAWEDDLIASVEERDKQLCPECNTLLEKQVSSVGKAIWNCSCPTASGGK